MQLLNPKQLNTVKENERDSEIKDLFARRKKIEEEITQFNTQRDTIVKSISLLEEEFNKFCTEINDKRKGLLNEIDSLEEKKQSLTNFIAKSRQEIQLYEA